MSDHFLRAHLQTVPLHRVIIRSLEAKLMSRLSWPRPLLDVGCGDGSFAEALFGRGGVEAGVDLDTRAIAEARRRRVYQDVRVASATALPFPDAMFGSVMNNCATEHIPDLDGVLAEANRVLQPGGQLAMTVPGPNFPVYLFWPTLFRDLGWPGLAALYGRMFNRISKHYHVYSAEEWRRRLGAHGFTLEHCEYYMSPKAHRLFDLSHYFSLPSVLVKRLTGRWILWPDKIRWLPLERWLRRYYGEETLATGAYLFLVSRKRAMSDEQ